MTEIFYNLDSTVSHVWDSSTAKNTVAGWLAEVIDPRDYRLTTMPRVNDRNVLECYQMRIRFLGPNAVKNAVWFKLTYHGVSPLA